LPDNLPLEITSFVGRQAALRDLFELARTTRLISLVGPCGVGKTRLAVRFAAARADAFADGVRLVDIADNPDLSAVANAVRDRQQLLILDTCEHHLKASAELAERILREWSDVYLVATSQEPLGVACEAVWRVPPLSLPPLAARSAEIRASEAGQLFLARARTLMHGFHLTDANAPVIARICQRLGGMPLGIELVAARAATLGLSELADVVGTEIDLDLVGARTAPARQLSLRAACQWRYDHVEENERLLLRRLAVFSGGWSLDAARAVCTDAQLPPDQLETVMQALVTKSLVFGPEDNSRPRYHMLAVTRQFARALLAEDGELGPLQRRHVDWCLGLAEREPPEAFNPPHADLLEVDLDNVRAALAWTVANSEPEVGVRIVIGAFPLWFLRGRLAEARTWLEKLLEAAGPSLGERTAVSARTWHARFLMLQGAYVEAERELAEILTRQRSSADPDELGFTLVLLANCAMWRGAFERAKQLYDDARVEMRGLDSLRLENVILRRRAVMAWQSNDLIAAADLADQLMDVARARRRPVAVARGLHIKGVIAAEQGDTVAGLRLLEKAIEQQRAMGDQHGLVDSLVETAYVMLSTGDTAGAHAACAEATRIASERGLRVRLMRSVEAVAASLATSHPDTAVQLAAATTESRGAMMIPRWPRDESRLEASLTIARALLGLESYSRAWSIGALMLESEAVALALSTPEPARAWRAHAAFTDREREVVRLFARGRSARQIAEELVISPATVRTHLDRATAKLGLHSRVGLANWAANAETLLAGEQ
jgi:predicted ATPase/DNA-binding CsgD family transcriptional regulator